MATRNTGKRVSKRPGRRKGTPKTGGRKKGTPNKATVEAKEACAEIVDDPKYRAKLLSAARRRKIPPAVECMLWHYAKGKPKEHFEGEVTVRDDSVKFKAEMDRLDDERAKQVQTFLKDQIEQIRAGLAARMGGTS